MVGKTVIATAAGVALGALPMAYYLRGAPRVSSNSLLEILDDGHLDEDVMTAIYHDAAAEAALLWLTKASGSESKGYARWAARLATEYKLEFGIPSRTVANRMVVRENLFKRLQKRNTRHRHMRCVLPLAIELVFLKDRSELELDELMRQPEMRTRAVQSVTPYWEGRSWAEWLATKLPATVRTAIGCLVPGALTPVPGFGKA